EAVAKSRAAAVLVAKVARCKLRMLLLAWTGLVSFRHQGLASLQRSADHHLLFSSFSAWLYAWHQGQAERRAVAKVEGWRALSSISTRRTEVLRACIKRKKVAFQLFKAWYWDSFSADVQAAAGSPTPRCLL
ncbi:predicted protein, partial [Haematococcus lacustris]